MTDYINSTKQEVLMVRIEYPAMIYRTNRNRGFIANCMIKNLIGFGKTEADALANLKESLQCTTTNEISLKPVYGISIAQ